MKKATIFVILALFSAGIAFGQTTVQVPYSGTLPGTPYSGNVPVTIPSGCTLSGTLASGLVVTCPTVVPPVIPPVTPPVVPPVTGRTKLTPSGSNDEAAVYAAAAKGPIELAGAFEMTSLAFPANSDVLCDPGNSISDMPGYSSYAVLWQVAAANVKLSGCNLTMPNSFKANAGNANQSTNQYNHCLEFYKATNSSATGLTFNQCGGDSIYVQFSSGVTVTGVTSTNPIRNGCSITDQNSNIQILNSTFQGANNLKVAGIADGCDFEPNGTGQGVPLAGAFDTTIVFQGNQFLNNAGEGFCFCNWFNSTAVPVTVSLLTNQASGNALGAFTENGPTGGLTQTGNSWQASLALTHHAKAVVHKLN